MRTIIQSAATYNEKGINSSVELASRAAELCIERSGIKKKDIDLVINIGVYRDENIVEPAMATLIQKRICLNLDPVFNPNQGITLSFDLSNGACGFLYAAKVVDTAIRSGATRNGLIVSSDVHASKEYNADFPFTHIGSAVLLSRSEKAEKGFKDFTFKSSYDGKSGLYGFANTRTYGTEGRKCSDIMIQADYITELKKFTGSVISEYVESQSLDISKINHFISTQQADHFGKGVADLVGVNGFTRIANTYKEYGDSCTSALSVGYCQAMQEGLLKDDDTVLFVAGGSGLTAGCALYIV